MRVALLPFVLGLLIVLVAAPAGAEDLPRAEPERVGLSSARLAEIDAAVRKRIESKEIAGAVTVVARGGRVAWFRAHGEFEKDTIFRIYSMTKPITVAAALILVDEGRLALDDPVSKFLPAFATLSVYGSEATPRPMTVRHLMTHTAGLTYGLFGNTPVDRQYRQGGILDRDGSLTSMAEKLAGLPLLYEPGERWHYSVAIDLLGHIIEVVSQKTLDVFFEERIFRPLGMRDTGFHVPAEAAGRLAASYGPKQRRIEDPRTSPFLEPPGLLSGGGGLVSTARDYTIFALMLAGGGTLNGKRILAAETVKAMTTNQLPRALVPIRFGLLPLQGTGFGLGVSVRVAAAGPGTRVGEWGWGGAASTTFFVCPAEDLVVVSMTQRMPMWIGLDRAIRPLVYAALRAPQPTPGGDAR